MSFKSRDKLIVPLLAILEISVLFSKNASAGIFDSCLTILALPGANSSNNLFQVPTRGFQ
jgi:hypothetical protein